MSQAQRKEMYYTVPSATQGDVTLLSQVQRKEMCDTFLIAT